MEKKREIDFIKERFQEENIVLDDGKAEQLYDFYVLLTEKNKVMNLTAITEFEDVVTKHFLDSVSLGRIVDMGREECGKDPFSLIDVGTGAGFPGIPLKIVFPYIKITLLDSLNKRVHFLEEVIQTLGLSDIEAVHGRAEDYGRKEEYREKYDLCVSRAVANLATLSEYCMPFVKVGGAFVSYKSGKVIDELEEIKRALDLLSGGKPEIKSFTLPGTDMDRILVKIEKVKPISKKYPRKAGTPSKEPLK